MTEFAGRIVSFYSFKGGVGRSMTLANVAWTLASAGKRVLVVDWDLESPSLHRYFSPFMEDNYLTSSAGVMDAALEALDDRLSPSMGVGDYAVSLDWPFSGAGIGDFMPAGRQSPSYGVVVSHFQWSSFVRSKLGEEFIVRLSQSMRANYEYILIDTHAGASDASATCTMRLADVVVLCMTLTEHMIEGSRGAAELISRESTNRSVRIFPVPTRVETAEHERLNDGRARARAALDGYLKHLPPMQLARYWPDVEVPYQPLYSFGETLAVYYDSPGEVSSVQSAAERLASYLIGGEPLKVNYPSPENRESVMAAYRGRGGT